MLLAGSLVILVWPAREASVNTPRMLVEPCAAVDEQYSGTRAGSRMAGVQQAGELSIQVTVRQGTF